MLNSETSAGTKDDKWFADKFIPSAMLLQMHSLGVVIFLFVNNTYCQFLLFAIHLSSD